MASDKPRYSYFSNLYPNTITTVIPKINKSDEFFNSLDSQDMLLLNRITKDSIISSLWNLLHSSYILPNNATKEDIVIQDIQFTKTFFKDCRALIIHYKLQDKNWIQVLKENEIGLSETTYKEMIIEESKSFNAIFREMLSNDLYYVYPSVFDKIK